MNCTIWKGGERKLNLSDCRKKLKKFDWLKEDREKMSSWNMAMGGITVHVKTVRSTREGRGNLIWVIEERDGNKMSCQWTMFAVIHRSFKNCTLCKWWRKLNQRIESWGREKIKIHCRSQGDFHRCWSFQGWKTPTKNSNWKGGERKRNSSDWRRRKCYLFSPSFFLFSLVLNTFQKLNAITLTLNNKYTILLFFTYIPIFPHRS